MIIAELTQKITDPKNADINHTESTQGRKRKLGSMKGQKFIADGHDIDECNDEIANTLGVEKRRALGIADGKYSIPDNIDECNDEIAEMFGVNQT